ncbi:DUF3303 domain-containing protein [Prochlorococcus marinus]|uniref:DUF3303 domain-containing protein n=1 Tax=Prochlorococcus marinus TaxID=1219 RepID=UPI0022B59F6F|nr:DUF3303 family protein [Prochlorococcus marinus]
MQTYLIYWQFSDQEAHMKGGSVFTQYVESDCESYKFEGFEDINRVVNPEGASGWAIVKHPITKQFKNGAALMLRI